MSKPFIKPLDNVNELTNVHHTFTQTLNKFFKLFNGDEDSVLDKYNATTKIVQQFLQDCVNQQRNLRVLGSNWSFTKIGYTNDWMLGTMNLNKMVAIEPTDLLEPSSFESHKYLLAQCGCGIQELSRVLHPLKRALKTSGASNGQTIAGAVSTGTHGAAIDFGATPEFVVGLHLIVSPTKHIYLERETKPLFSPSFADAIGAELVRDDDLFNAALVSFGSFGYIHGVMIETEPRYLLNSWRKRVPLEDLKTVMETLDFSSTPFLPIPNQRPFHFQVLVNPYDLGPGAYVTIMYKREYKEDYPRTPIDYNKAGPGEDAPSFLGRLTKQFPIVTHLVVNELIKKAYAPYDDQWGTLNEVFYNTDIQGKVLSAAVAIPVSYTNTVLNILLQLNKTGNPFVGVFAFRYVKQSTATLGFTKFPFTCVAEFDSVESPNTRDFYTSLWNELDNANVPYTFHWGKINNLDASRINKMYGNSVTEWIEARNKVLPGEMLSVFTNETMSNWGLDKKTSPPVA
jgi:hypothetical protein